jgi:hypothetical protein
MTDEEILLKYRTTIDVGIEKLITEYGLTTDAGISALTLKYEQNFIKGFHEGVEKREKEKKDFIISVAQKLLAKGKSIDEIIECTELTKEEIENLQSQNP